MKTEIIIPDNSRFIMLDVLNTRSTNDISRDYPKIQFVNPSDNNAYQSIEFIKDRIGSGSEARNKREDLFKITLNMDNDYIMNNFK